MYKRLLPLALATFAVGTDGFVLAGLLPSIADDLDVSVARAGQLVTAFALTFAVAAPLLGWATSALDRRTALLWALGVFVVGNAATAPATQYGAVLAARVLTAVGAGIITSTASSAAAAVAPPERRGRALAFVLGGLTLSTAVGLPLGTLIGRGDWHVTLWAVAALGLVAALGVAAGIPRITLPAIPLRARLAPLRERLVQRVLVVSMLAMAGTYLLYTYIGAALVKATDDSEGVLTVALFGYGLGVLSGNLLAGHLSDRHPPERVLVAGLAAAVPVLAVGRAAVETLPTALVWAALWGVCVGLPVVPQQHRLVAHAPAATPVLLGLNSSARYLGVAAGGALGGLAQQWMSPLWLGLPGAAVTALALLIAAPRTGRSAHPVPEKEVAAEVRL
ncbi:MFS transporter [Embleya sp. AB8]|uniref:MFS transporter n=1 Tax=Embleya sp. AB8 TaxID=3156304 RepID=UPI003C780D14